ncbi:DNA polymerase III subunit epsilon [Marinagarivorans algicola]|uniref:DNA polymerase III subunit epsilon n=1 Tax=Marinagarivorans algicola TaxID=1513270 RepID=UPI0006B67CBF|nr:DNA polymerase III subunit epsilon [Marinagarivorans algicola]
MSRQIVLDTETTGLEPKLGHRIIEIGCVELINRKLTGRHYHQYINPEREIDEGAMAVHGITNEFVAAKPVFAAIVDEFREFIRGAELVIHNAPFDVGFMDNEFALLNQGLAATADICSVLDTLAMARNKHPGQKNNLDALCKRYGVDNSSRDLHGALLDAEILADVYLLMTGGQRTLALSESEESDGGGVKVETIQRLSSERQPLPIIMASDAELKLHEAKLQAIHKAAGQCIWLVDK